MEELSSFFNNILKIQIVNSIVIIFLSIIMYKGIAHVINKSEKRNKTLDNKRKTYLRLIKSIIRYIFIIVTILILLQINGIDVSSMLAGVGIAGVIIGFAVQDVLKDIIKGSTIISDKYFQVGDVIKYNDIEGKVLTVGLKTTKIKDVKTFNIVSIANRNIEQVEVVSNLINIDVPMPYETDIHNAEKAIQDILNRVKELENVDKCEYRGVNDLADSSIKYQIKVYCEPDLKVQMRRDVLRCVLLGLSDNNIQVPYNQIDVHNK